MKRFFVYYNALAKNPAETEGFDTYEQAAGFAVMMYGHDHKPDIRKEFYNDLNIAEAL